MPTALGAVCIQETLWLPEDGELGQHRHWFVAPAAAPELSPLGVDYLPIERIAAAGMREIFNGAGLQTFHEQTEDHSTYDTPVVMHETGLTFPDESWLAQRVDALVSGLPDGTRFSFSTLPPGKFAGSDWIPALANRQIKFSAERTINAASRFNASYFQHDLRLHVAAWLCMPPLITTEIYRQTCEAAAEFISARDSKEQDWRKYDARFGPAQERIKNLTADLDIINTIQLDNLLRRENERITGVLASILGGSADVYKKAILDHIANPRQDK